MPLTTYEERHNNSSQPDYWHPYFRKIKPTLEYLLDMWVGKRRWMADDGDVEDSEKAYYYLPKSSAQTEEHYVEQLRNAVFIRYFRTAIEKDIAGLLTNFVIDDPGDLEEFLDNVDLAGNSIKVFSQMCVSMALRDGSSFILVDKAKSDGDLTLADASDRPYFILFTRDQVVNWRHRMTANGFALDMVTLRQDVYKPDGEYGIKEYETYRVLRSDGTYSLYEQEKTPLSDLMNPSYDGTMGEMALVEEGQYGTEMIPLIGLSLTSSDPFTADPPLIDLADLNLKHYRIGSTLDCTLSAMVPTLHANEIQGFAIDQSGRSKNLNIGPNAVQWNLDKLAWVEATGTGVEPMERAMERIVAEINKMTLSFFMGSSVAKTATEVELDAAQAESALAGYAHHFESAMQSLFGLWYEYMGKDPGEAPKVVVDKALIKPPVAWTPKEILEWVSLGAMSREMAYRIMADLEMLPEGVELDDFEEEMMGEQDELRDRMEDDNGDTEDDTEDTGTEDNTAGSAS